MAAASSSSLPAGNSLCLNDGNIPDNNSNDCNNRRCCCDKNDNIRNAANVTSNMTADGSDTFRTAARPTPLVTENSIASNTATAATYSPRRHPTATSTSSPLRKKKNAVVESRSSKKTSSKKQPLGKMWIRHVPIAFKPCSNYYQSRDNSRKDEQPSLLHHQNHYQQPREGDSTDSYLSTVFLLSSPTNDHGSSTFHSPHPPANSHSFQQPQSQPKYFYRRPHSLRSSITTVHAFGESGKPLSTSLTSSSSHSSSPKSAPIASPSNHATLPLRTDPSYSCYNHHNMHEDSLVHSSFSGYSSKHGVFALETNGHGDHHANANVNADDGGYYDNYVFPEKDAAPVVKLMGC
mmetsp:Transcript_18805/g.39472  ORF Transcript_18805/g.39472 Transcript_18805/m.39472 type:complete len:349 (+) Transcript_18805:346-1392(+)